MKKPTKVSAAKLRELAVEAQADPRTVANVLAGGTRDGMTRKRIVAALKKAGLLASLITALAISGACDSTGAPVSGGTAYLTAPGSASVAVTGWANANATVALPTANGGYPLDAGGRAQIFLNQPADIRVEDASGTTVATYKETGGTAPRVEVLNAGYTGTDPVSGAQVPGGRTYLDTVLSNLYTSFGGTDGRFLASSTATKRTVQAKFLELSVSVKDFGAVGDGRTDDTAACQSAINAQIAAGGGSVLFPPGTYLTSSALTVTSKSIYFIGAGGATVVKNSNGAGNCFTITSVSPVAFSQMAITASPTSTGVAISAAIGGNLTLNSMVISGHASAVSAAGAPVAATNVVASNPDASVLGVLAMSGGSNATIIGGSWAGGAASSGITFTGTGVLTAIGTIANGVTYGIDLGTSASMYAYGVRNTGGGGSYGFRAATGTSTVFHQGCDWGPVGVLDQRTGAPVNYTFAVDSAVTPLPNQTDTLRVRSTAAITVTVNAPPTMGFGRRWTMMCLNNSGGATTWTFNAVYKLSAAVAPANGNMVSLILEYDPISSIVREVGRAATAI